MKVLLVGARGFLGRSVRQALSGVAEVIPASRRPSAPGWARVDLQDPGTFGAIEPADVVMNCSDSIDASGVALALHCLERGKLFLEPAHSTERIDEYLQCRLGPCESGQGRVVVGCGLFPGMTNVLAREATRLNPAATQVHVGIAVGVLAGAGKCMCRHMIHHLEVPTFWYEKDQRRESRSITTGAHLPALSRSGYTVRVPFCETEMLKRTLSVSTVDTNLALRPPVLTSLLKVLSFCARRLPGARWVMEWSMIALRGHLLARRPPGVYISVVAANGSATARLQSYCRDGIQAAAAVLVSTAKRLTEQAPPQPPGIYTLDQLFPLSELVEGIATVNKLAGWDNPFEVHSS